MTGPEQRRKTLTAAGFAAVPVLALTLGIFGANRLEPWIAGMPFLLAWIVGWIVVTPVFMYAAYRTVGPSTDE